MLPLQGANGGCAYKPKALPWAEIKLAFSQVDDA